MTSAIESRASFERVRYAQLWEDADVLCAALDEPAGAMKGKTLVSICSAGDNALAMLTLDPERVVAVDLSAAQIACMNVRIAAYRTLDHAAFLELMGARPSERRATLLDTVLAASDEETAAFWNANRADAEAHGLGGAGKFESYFRTFRRFVLPLAHSRRTIDDVFVSRPHAERDEFFERRWDTWRWRWLLKGFFSNFVMGRMGRDPAFFDYVEGSLSDHVSGRLRHAAVDLDPAENPYLHWILKGTHGEALPMAWRTEHFDTIRERLDRLEVRHGSLETFVATGERAHGFNLSDIFEYMDERTHEAVYRSVLDAAHPGARLVYWNMMVPRRVPASLADRVERVEDAEARGKAADKAFFYSDFVVERVR